MVPDRITPEPANSPEALQAVAASLRQSAWLLAQFWEALHDQGIPELAAGDWVTAWWTAYCADMYETAGDDDG